MVKHTLKAYLLTKTLSMRHCVLLVLAVSLLSCIKEDFSGNNDTGTFHLAVTMEPEGSGSVSISSGKYLAGEELELAANAGAGFRFIRWKGDVNGADSNATLIMNSDRAVQAIFKADTITELEIVNPIAELVITHRHKFQVLGKAGTGQQIDISDQVEIIDSSERTTIEDNWLIGAKSGMAKLTIKYDSLTINEELFINPIEFKEVDGFLAVPAENSIITVPVVVINYLPTQDGIHIDQTYFPIRDYADEIVQDLKIEQVEKWILANDIKTKFGIEEGSRFRGFSNPDAPPYIGIRVLHYINMYEVDKVFNPQSIDEQEGYFPDYHSIFSLIDLETLVNEMGVKEVWFNRKSLAVPESNMSSPLTGDVSNSTKEPSDLPIYQRTYVVYGNSVHRWYAQNLHNRGHQLEAQLAFIEDFEENNSLFWNDFVGFARDGSAYNQEGRCGATHFTPNSTADYDYGNSDEVWSDIFNWRPDRRGSQSIVSANTWMYSRRINAEIPSVTDVQRFQDLSSDAVVGTDPEGGWLIFWFQSIPGYRNNIPYVRDGQNTLLENWWDIFYNWDEAIQKGMNGGKNVKKSSGIVVWWQIKKEHFIL